MVWRKRWETKKEKEIQRSKTSPSSHTTSLATLALVRSPNSHLYRRAWQQRDPPDGNSHHCKPSRNSCRRWPFVNNQPNFGIASEHTFSEYSSVNIGWTLIQYTDLAECRNYWRDSSRNCHDGPYSFEGTKWWAPGINRWNGSLWRNSKFGWRYFWQPILVASIIAKCQYFRYGEIRQSR